MHFEERRDGARQDGSHGNRASQRLVAGATLLLGGLLALAAAAGPESGPPFGANPVLADVGGTFFRQYCTSCHGMEGRGDGPTAAVLKKPPADLTRIAARRGGEFPAAEIAMYIDGRFEVAAHGSREMPVWGQRFGAELGPGEQAQEVVRGRVIILVEYLKSIQQPAE